MASRLIRCARRVRGIGLLVALLALACQVALGAVVPPGDAADELATLDAVGILCAGPAVPGDGGSAPHRRHAADLALCPVAMALAQPALLPTSDPVPSASSAILAPWSHDRPPGRGPPPPTARVGAPRAPPVPA